MTETIERLSKSKEMHIASIEERHKNEGRTAGRSWAERQAGYAELKAMADEYQPENPDYCQSIDDDGLPLAVARVALGDEYAGWNDTVSFFQQWLEDEEDVTASFAAGFIEGAAEVYHEVEDKL